MNFMKKPSIKQLTWYTMVCNSNWRNKMYAIVGKIIWEEMQKKHTDINEPEMDEK
jgi:hypothetical protein